MNNEERILELLTGLTEKVDRLEAGQEELRNRVTAIEETQGGILETQGGILETQGTIVSRITSIELTQENRVMTYLHTLAEGHEAIMGKLVPESRVEAVEDDVTVLKTVTKEHSRDIAELKKAK